MTIYYSPSRQGFFDEAIHGARTKFVPDEDKLAELAALETEPGAAELEIAKWRAEFSTDLCKPLDPTFND